MSTITDFPAHRSQHPHLAQPLCNAFSPLDAAPLRATRKDIPGFPPPPTPPKPSWLPSQTDKHTHTTAKPPHPRRSIFSPFHPTEPDEERDPLAPRYSDADQATLDTARFVAQEAFQMKELVSALGFFPAQKKEHGRLNAQRARTVLGQLGAMQAVVEEWMLRGGHEEDEMVTAGMVQSEVAALVQAVGGCGWELWEVEDATFVQMCKSAMEALEAQVAAFGVVGAGGTRAVAGMRERIQEVVMKYLEVVHLVVCVGDTDGVLGAQLEAVFEKMLGMTAVLKVETVLREQAALVCNIVAGVAVRRG